MQCNVSAPLQQLTHSLHSHTPHISQSPQKPQVGFEGGEVVVRAQLHVPVCPALRLAACLGSFDECLLLFQANLGRCLWCSLLIRCWIIMEAVFFSSLSTPHCWAACIDESLLITYHWTPLIPPPSSVVSMHFPL